MKSFLVLKISLTLFFLLVASADAREIHLGYIEFPPYEYNDNGEASGMLVEIVKKLFVKINVDLKLSYLSFNRAFEETKSGNIDGVFNLYKTPGRLAFFDYTEPFHSHLLVFFVKKESGITFNRLSDLEGLNIGVMHGYSYGNDFDENRLLNKIVSHTHDTNFKRLVDGHLDVYPADKFAGAYIAEQNNLMIFLKTLPKPLCVMKGHVGFTKGKFQDIIEKLNSAIHQMKKHGEIQKIMGKYNDEIQECSLNTKKGLKK
jgi:polar amino acid transport system substrate-binding protein